MTATDSRISAWSDVLVGTLVTLRRGPLTGERVERTKAWTASGPYISDTGVACIRVDVAGAVVSYALDRVSLGYDEPRPVAITRVPLALALDPPPEDGWSTLARSVAVVVAMLVIYVVGFGLGPVLDWVAR